MVKCNISMDFVHPSSTLARHVSTTYPCTYNNIQHLLQHPKKGTTAERELLLCWHVPCRVLSIAATELWPWLSESGPGFDSFTRCWCLLFSCRSFLFYCIFCRVLFLYFSVFVLLSFWIEWMWRKGTR